MRQRLNGGEFGQTSVTITSCSLTLTENIPTSYFCVKRMSQHLYLASFSAAKISEHYYTITQIRLLHNLLKKSISGVQIYRLEVGPDGSEHLRLQAGLRHRRQPEAGQGPEVDLRRLGNDPRNGYHCHTRRGMPKREYHK